MMTLGPTWLLAVGSQPMRPTTVADVEAALIDYGSDGTAIRSRGIWQGVPEDSVVAVVAGLEEVKVLDLARFFAAQFDQTGVLVLRMGTAYVVAAQPFSSSDGRSSEPALVTNTVQHPDARAASRKGLSKARGRRQNKKEETWRATAQR